MHGLPLVRHDPAAVFACRDGVRVTACEFLADATRVAAALPERRHVVNLCSDRYRFVVGFAAALLRRHTTLMPPNQTPDFLARLERAYPDLYRLTDALLDAPATAQACGALPEIPVDHVAAILFTSGSEGAPKDVPSAACRPIASTTSGWAWPTISGPQLRTRST